MTDREAGSEQGANGTIPETTPEDRRVAAEPRPSGRLPYLSISPKWQFILIGGIFITINIMVMIAFVVALALRH